MAEEEKVVQPQEEVKPQSAETTEGKSVGGTRYAGFWIRFLAVFIDGLIFSIIVMPVLRLMFPIADGATSSYYSTATDINSVLTAIYSVTMITLYGATVGKMAVGIRVVTVDGSKITWTKAIMREIVGKFVSAIILLIGFIMVAFDAKKQGLHDKIAGTYVVYKK